MIEIIVEVEGGIVSGVYSNASIEQDFSVAVLDRDAASIDYECKLGADRLTEVIEGPGWRGID